jgi:hypothetical protein
MLNAAGPRAGGGSSPEVEAAVIGAGPYGLSAAAYLRHAGVEAILFGEPMEFWERHMPRGMLLRSRRRSSQMPDPEWNLSIENFEAETGTALPEPIPLESYLQYTRWYQQHAVPDVDTRKVTKLRRNGGGFELTLSDASRLRSTHVVVASGLSRFAWHSPPFDGFDGSFVSHSSDHSRLDGFAGKRVLVVGSGQSGLETAALLTESDADVEVVGRQPAVRWLSSDDSPSPAARINAAILPPTDVGGRVTGWVAAAPDLLRMLPGGWQRTVARRCTLPAGSGWLRPRLSKAKLTLGVVPVAARAQGTGMVVSLSDGGERHVEHVLLATGYRVDIAQLEFLAPELLGAIRTFGGCPILGPGFESESVPGLHFVGASASMSFGPVMRFVVGTWYAAPTTARRILGRRRRTLRMSYRSRLPASLRRAAI